ncbi:MAG: hypothetical protein ACOC2U_00775 [bacterium]
MKSLDWIWFWYTLLIFFFGVFILIWEVTSHYLFRFLNKINFKLIISLIYDPKVRSGNITPEQARKVRNMAKYHKNKKGINHLTYRWYAKQIEKRFNKQKN